MDNVHAMYSDEKVIEKIQKVLAKEEIVQLQKFLYVDFADKLIKKIFKLKTKTSYAPQEQKITAGTPLMIAQDISLFDGQQHSLMYSFGSKKQGLYYDGELVASGEFKVLEDNHLTGLVTGVSENIVSDSFYSVEVR